MTGWRLGYVIAPGALPVGGQDRRPLHDQRRLDADAVGRASRRSRAAPSSWPSGRPGTAPGATAWSPGCEAAGFELEAPRAALYLFPKTPVLARHGLARGRADAARRGQDRHRPRRRLRPRGRRPPALLVLRLRRDDRGRRRGAGGVREPGRRRAALSLAPVRLRPPIGRSAGNFAGVADGGGIDVADEDRLLAPSPRRGPRPTGRSRRSRRRSGASALADAVDAGDVAEVLDRAGAQERAPVLAARLGPVGDEGEEVGVARRRGGRARESAGRSRRTA